VIITLDVINLAGDGVLDCPHTVRLLARTELHIFSIVIFQLTETFILGAEFKCVVVPVFETVSKEKNTGIASSEKKRSI